MRRLAAIGAALLGCASALVQAGQTQQPTGPLATFRGDVDLVQVDVTVLDKNRKPVRNLKAGDFTIFEDGVERPVAAFAPIGLPAQPAALPSWASDSSPDVMSNKLPDEGRLVLIVFDRTIGVGEPALTAIRIAGAAVDALGPGDEAAVVHTGPGPSQNFTTDRARIRRAVGYLSPSGDVSPDAAGIEQEQIDRTAEETGIQLSAITNTGACYCGLCVLETITRAAEALRDVTSRRKTMLFIGSQVVLQGRVSPAGIAARDDASIDSVTECGFRLNQARDRMLRALDVSNVTIHSIDPTGLSTVSPTARASTPGRQDRGTDTAGMQASRAAAASLENNNTNQNTLRVLPDYTGGRTVLNVNMPQADVADILAESGTYYLLGFKPANPAADGRYHRVEVKVARKDVEVRARHGYLAPSPPAPAANLSAAVRTWPASLLAAISPVLPRRDFVVDVAAAPFASAADTGSEVLVSLGIQVPPRAAGDVSTLNVLTEAMSQNGGVVVWHRQSIGLALPPVGAAEQYEAFSRLALKPGRYEVRAGVEDRASGKVASVYTFVEVPNFSKLPISLSGVALSGSSTTVPADQKLDDLVPSPPTTRRQFGRSERVSLFVRVHQGGVAAMQPAGLTVRIRGANNRVVSEQTSPLAAGAFDASRSAPYRFDLPLATLPPGDFLLTIEATRGKDTARRDVQFSVK